MKDQPLQYQTRYGVFTIREYRKFEETFGDNILLNPEEISKIHEKYLKCKTLSKIEYFKLMTKLVAPHRISGLN